jgi:hypothetical protein
MNTRKGICKGGGTPKGVKKPHRRMTRETTGFEDPGYGESFMDVGRACTRFLRERVSMGVMSEKEAMPQWPRKIQNSSFKTQQTI